jgi:hypothetical protein
MVTPSPVVDRPAVSEFFTALWPDDVPQGLGLILWGGKKVKPIRCTSTDAAALAAETLAKRGAETYFGVALQDLMAMDQEAERREREGQGHGPEWTRGYISTSAGIPGLWLDIDIDDEGRGKEGLPRTLEDVDQILAALPAPTAQVQTGGGVHAYWLFREPWMFGGEGDRQEAAQLLRRWHAWGSSAGWTVDQANDLARVLRPVGSWSAKRRRTVDLRHGQEVAYRRRYNPSELLEAAEQFGPRFRPRQIALGASGAQNGSQVNGGLAGSAAGSAAAQAGALRPALVDQERLAALLEVEGFALLWAKKAPGVKSASEYDWALAMLGVKAGLDDAEILGLWYQWAQEHGRDVAKYRRPDYVGGTLAKARAAVAEQAAREQAEEQKAEELEAAVDVLVQAAAASKQQPAANGRSEATEPVSAPPADAVLDARQRLLGELGARLEIPLERIVRHSAKEKSTFSAWIGGVSCPLGSIAALMDQHVLRSAIAASTLRVIPRVSREDWPDLCKQLVAVVEDEDMGDASDPEGQILAYVEAYLSGCHGLEQPFQVEERAALMEQGHAFTRDGSVWWSLQELCKYLRLQGLPYELGSVAALLRRAGAQPRKHALPRTRKMRWFWTLPHPSAHP